MIKIDLNEATIGDIILCEPITRKGIASLNKIGLTIKEISPSFFIIIYMQNLDTQRKKHIITKNIIFNMNKIIYIINIQLIMYNLKKFKNG